MTLHQTKQPSGYDENNAPSVLKMPKCVNGHESASAKCETCGETVLFQDSCKELAVIPEFEVEFEQTAVLSVGFPPLSLPQAYAAQVLLGEDDAEAIESFTVGKIEGGTWLDFYQKYSDRFGKWLKLVGFDRSRYRIVVADTTNPLSVLLIQELNAERNKAIFAIAADIDSNPLEQHTSYVALTAALRKHTPIILIMNKYRKEATSFVESEGLLLGDGALGRIISLLLTSAEDLMDFLQRDIRFGIQIHAFSALMAASDRIYKSIDEVFSLQRYQTSLDIETDEPQTAYLMASSERELKDSIVGGFSRYCSRQLLNLISSEHRFYERQSRHRLYDIAILYGLRTARIYDGLTKGYETITSKAPDLVVDKLQ